MAQANIVTVARDRDRDTIGSRPPGKQEPARPVGRLSAGGESNAELVSILRKKTAKRQAAGKLTSPAVKLRKANANQDAQLESSSSTSGPIATGSGSGAAAGPKKVQKPRRRVATIAQRRAANIRERRRMFNLNAAFDRLRKKVPSFAYEKRLSRIETLKLAIMYIRFMDDLVKDDAYAEKYKQLLAQSTSSQPAGPSSQNSFPFSTSLPNQDAYISPLYCQAPITTPPPPPPFLQARQPGSGRGVDNADRTKSQDCRNVLEGCCQAQYSQMICSNGAACYPVNSPPSLYSSSSSSACSSSCQSSSPASSSSTSFADSSSSSPVAGKPISLLFDNYNRHQTCIPASIGPGGQQPVQYSHAYEQFQDNNNNNNNISISTYYNCEPPAKYYNELGGGGFEQKLACYPKQYEQQAASQISDLSQAHSNQFEQQQQPPRHSLPLPASPANAEGSTNGGANYSLQSLEAR